mmetsp:Transcript_29053/g.84837  ORF Transcript_29053/g.84837 Transcript_29053/m.84837 type:complete len:208 (-) Transcript_29053:704-1327(-)
MRTPLRTGSDANAFGTAAGDAIASTAARDPTRAASRKTLSPTRSRGFPSRSLSPSWSADMSRHNMAPTRQSPAPVALTTDRPLSSMGGIHHASSPNSDVGALCTARSPDSPMVKTMRISGFGNPSNASCTKESISCQTTRAICCHSLHGRGLPLLRSVAPRFLTASCTLRYTGRARDSAFAARSSSAADGYWFASAKVTTSDKFGDV